MSASITPLRDIPLSRAISSTRSIASG